MRNLQNKDIFAFGRILSKANLKEEIKKVALGEDTHPDSLGFDLLFTVFTNCSDKAVEEEVYTFLADLFEEDVEAVRTGEPMETFEKLKNIADWEKWKSFFSLGVKSMK